MSACQILVVEDENLIARDIQHSLQSLGYEVPAIVATGEDAVERAEQIQPDLVLMDIRLRGKMDGIEAAGIISERFRLPVVFLTSYSDESTLQRAKGSEPFGYILKPFEDRDLRSAIEIALARHENESRVKESADWLGKAVHDVCDAVITTDGEGKVATMNPIAEALTGWKLEQAIGHPLDQVLSVADQRAGVPVEGPVPRLRWDGSAAHSARRTVLTTRQGVRREIDGTALALWHDEATLKGGIVVFRDITERRLLETRLRSAVWLEGLAVRTAGLSGQLVALIDEARQRVHEARAAAADSTSPSPLSIVESALASTAGILRELHDYPAIAAALQPLDLKVLVQDSVHLIEGGLPDSVILQLDLPEEPAFVRAGREQICHALFNLVLHATRSGGENPQVYITCGVLEETREVTTQAFPAITQQKLAFLEVSERASGLKPQDVRPRFDPLFDSGVLDPGLGLGVVFAIARAHSGAIHLSESNGGLAVRLLLPLIDAAC